MSSNIITDKIIETKCYLGGYISVYSALISNSRKVYTVLFDRARYDKVMKGKYHLSEKRQYSLLRKACNDKGVTIRFVSFDGKEHDFGNECGGIAAEVGERVYTTEAELLALKNPYLAALDGIEDPYNFGQVLRSFYASGVDAVIVPKRNFFTASSIVARASAGASELMKVCAVEDIEAFCTDLKQNGIKLYATAANDKALNVFNVEYKKPLCVIFGGERRGISKKVMERCDATLQIVYPRNVNMALSASSAAAVIAFEIGRRIN